VVPILAVASFTLFLVWQTIPVDFNANKRNMLGLKIPLQKKHPIGVLLFIYFLI
jgi:hypothetical protein